MPSASNALLQYEAGQTQESYTALTGATDNKEFNSTASMWSRKGDYAPTVRPNGLVSGGICSVSTTNDNVEMSAATCYLSGVLTSVSADATNAVTRGLTTDTHNQTAITITSSGVYASVAGTDHTAFSDVIGDPGGPPWIPTTSILVAIVKTTSITSAVITADEIKQISNSSQERYDYPTWDVRYAEVTSGTLGTAGVDFHSALLEIHSDDAGSTSYTKKVFVEYATPDFANLPKATDFVPPETSHSTSSTQIYGLTLGASSETLNQGSFTAYLEDGISDALLANKNEILFFKFYQNRSNDPYILTQGTLGVTRSFPAGDNISASCTISAEDAALEVTA